MLNSLWLLEWTLKEAFLDFEFFLGKNVLNVIRFSSFAQLLCFIPSSFNSVLFDSMQSHLVLLHPWTNLLHFTFCACLNTFFSISSGSSRISPIRTFPCGICFALYPLLSTNMPCYTPILVRKQKRPYKVCVIKKFSWAEPWGNSV